MGMKAYHPLICKSGNGERLGKVVKPRVYITERSKFKKLVQELTGNNNGTVHHSIPTVFSPGFLEIRVAEEVGVPVIDHDQYDPCLYKVVNDYFTLDSSSSDESSDESTASPFSRDTSCSVDEDCDGYLSDLQKFLQDYSTPNEMEMEMEDLFAYHQEIDSSILDNAETSSLYDCFAQMEQEVSFYDYEMDAGLLSSA